MIFVGLFESRNADDYEGALTSLRAAGGDPSKLSGKNRALVNTLMSESSPRGREAKNLVNEFNRKH